MNDQIDTDDSEASIITSPPNWLVLFLAGICCRCCLSSSVMLLSRLAIRVRGRSACQRPGAWAVGRPTLYGGPVVLRPIRATPCWFRVESCIGSCLTWMMCNHWLTWCDLAFLIKSVFDHWTRLLQQPQHDHDFDWVSPGWASDTVSSRWVGAWFINESITLTNISLLLVINLLHLLQAVIEMKTCQVFIIYIDWHWAVLISKCSGWC